MATIVSSNLDTIDDDFVRYRPGIASSNQTLNLSSATVSRSGSLEHVAPKDEVVLKRHLGLFSGICFIIGCIVGSGIFVSPKGVLRGTESVGLCLIVWVGSGLVSLVGALCYAELGALIPRNGAEISYMKEGIGSLHQGTGDVCAYLYMWTSAFIMRPSSMAILTLTFSQYFLSGVFLDCGTPDDLVKITAVLAILLLMNINCISVSATNRLNIFFVITKVVMILTVIIIGFVRMAQGHLQTLQTGFEGTTKKPLSVALAFYSGLWAYDGWNSLNSIAEEVKNPKRNLWLSIVLAMPSIIVLYLLTNVSYFTVMSKAELLSSSAVAVTWGEVAIRPIVRLLPILISISALGTASATLFASARYCMVGAQYGYLPEVFACIHKYRLTPVPNIIFQGGLAICLCMPSNIDGLIDFFSFSAWIFYAITFSATLICKFTMKDAPRVIKVPIPLIILIILVAIYLVIAPVIADPQLGFLIAGLLILFSLVFYYPFVYRKIQVKFMRKVNHFLIAFFQLQKAQIKI